MKRTYKKDMKELQQDIKAFLQEERERKANAATLPLQPLVPAPADKKLLIPEDTIKLQVVKPYVLRPVCIPTKEQRQAHIAGIVLFVLIFLLAVVVIVYFVMRRGLL